MEPRPGVLRFYDPKTGRFVSRDPLGLWGDEAQAGNGQGYCGHNAVNRVDPFGDAVPLVGVAVLGGSAAAETVAASEAAKALEPELAYARVRLRDAVDDTISWLDDLFDKGKQAVDECLSEALATIRRVRRIVDAGRAVSDAASGTQASDVVDTTTTTQGGQRKDGFRSFAHGTSLDSATSIAAGGLLYEAGRALSRGGSANRPGHFHTYELGGPGAPGGGMQAAYEWGLRHAPQPVVLVMTILESTFETLRRAGLVTIEPTPGAGSLGVPPQVVFHPGAYPILNSQATWQVVDPYGRR